jgi:hypothetical protein
MWDKVLTALQAQADDAYLAHSGHHHMTKIRAAGRTNQAITPSGGPSVT